MGVKWTEKQNEAITSRDADLLVSAAAGSGKTAVLVERVKRIILEEKVDIDRILVVTFTKAAASEMKEKIIKAIEEELESGNSDGPFLRRQLDRMSDADISTFHSFAFRIIRRYFQLVDVEPDFAVMEEGETAVAKADAAEQLFEELYESGDEEFIDFLKCYSSDRNDRALKESLVKLYDKIMTTPEPFEWLKDNVQELDTDEDRFAESRFLRLLENEVGRLVRRAAELYRQGIAVIEDHGLEKMAAKASEEAEQIFAMEESLGKADWDKLASMVESFKSVNMRAPNYEKEEWEIVKPFYSEFREAAKKAKDTIRDKYMAIPLAETIEDISLTYPKAGMLQRLLTEYDRIYREMKKEQNVLDYSDAEHYALAILKNEQVRKEYREKFRYVFVDEYQDCNIVQDTLLHQVSSPGNLFMVGDVKQSIYKFRLAEPELFRAKYGEFSQDGTGFKQKIDLNMNFRSKENVIRAVNAVFGRNMEGYDDNAALYRGDDYEGEYQPETGLCLIRSGTDREDLPPDVAGMKDQELEGHAIAKIIKKYVGTYFHDSKENTDRKMTFRDIVILRRSVKDVAYSWQQVFSQYGIPFYCSDSNGYFDTIEVMVFLDFLRLIDNSRRDVPLLATMRSVIGGFSIDEMIKVRLHARKGAFYEALKTYCEEGEDEALKAKCLAFSERMDSYRQMAKVVPLGELLWRLMDDTGYFLYAGGLDGGLQRQANLRALVDRAVAYQNAHGGSIYGFLHYIDAMEEKKVDVPQASVLGEQDDVVRLMTIHKSKGLEYPMVIVSGLHRERRAGKGKGKREILIHKDVGIGMPRVDYDHLWFRKGPVRLLIETREQREEAEEDIRVLYVALTRARDRLVLTGVVDDVEKEKDRYEMFDRIPECKNYLDVIGPSCEEAGIGIHTFSIDAFMEGEEAAVKRASEIDDTISAAESGSAEGGLKELIESRLSYKYENEKACRVKSKYSVTELNKTAAGHAYEQKTILDIPEFAAGTEYEDAASRGTAMHTVMEHLDFAGMHKALQEGNGSAFLEDSIEKMTDKGIMTADQAEMIAEERILKLFDTDLGRRAAGAAEKGSLYREAPFNVLSRVDGVEVMVQGVIDCWFREDDGLVLFDYKTSYIDKKDPSRSIEKIKETYKGQLELYRDALEQTTGEKVKEVYLYLFGADQPVAI